MDDALRVYHKEQAECAREIYIQSRTPDADAEDWKTALREARRLIGEALRASDYLRDVAEGMLANADHGRILRYILAPPLSQDQFALLYPTEKNLPVGAHLKLTQSAR